VRIIAATNKDINNEIKMNRFRADLFYRLNKYYIKVPPLRDRKKDILPLAKHFTKIHARENLKKIRSLAPDLVESLISYTFPGNVRELENIIAAAVLLEKEKTLTLSSVRNHAPLPDMSLGHKEDLITLAQLEKQHILKVLKAAAGSRKQAAKILGVDTSTVYRKLAKYNLTDKI
jgi:transcriptional regulator with PAS, ATPase and Fis domain